MGVISEVKSVVNVITEVKKVKRCPIAYILAIKDAINVMHGKWKFHIIGSLIFGKKRFKELEREIPKITPRMLSKELRDLEANGIVKRTVYDTIPVRVEYELTESGRSFEQIMDVMVKWGLEHRKKVLGERGNKLSESDL